MSQGEAQRSVVPTHTHVVDRSVVELLSELVSIQSQTENFDGVRNAQELIMRELSTLGLSTSLVNVVDRGPILVADSPRQPNQGFLLILLHVDTAYRVEEFDPPRLEGDRLFGSGSFDMKGSIVMVVSALRQFTSSISLEELPIRIVVNSAEESPSDSSLETLRELARGCTDALVPESGRDGVVVARKGIATFQIEVRGRSAHAGNNIHRGINAIVELSRCIPRISALTDPNSALTCNIGKIGGGGVLNTVADYACVELEVRSPARHSLMTMEQTLQTIVQETLSEGATGQVTLMSLSDPLECRQASMELFEVYRTVAADHGEEVHCLPVVGGASDANSVAAIVPGGIIDALGPRGEGLHELGREWVSIPSVTQRGAIFADFLKALRARKERLDHGGG